MVKSSPSVKLALLAASSVGAAGAALMAFRRPIEAGLFARTAFWVLWVLVVMGAWAVTVAVVERLREGDGRRWRRDAALSLGLCLALSAVVFLAVPSQFRVLADETNLLSKSLAMYRKGEFFNWVEGYFLMDDFFPVLQAVPHRPGLFPFLTYLVHAISGYSVKAPFVVNFFVLTAFLWVIRGLAAHLVGRRAGYVALGLTLGFPLVAIYATSAGYDLLAALGLASVTAALLWVLEKPTALRGEVLLWLAALSGHARYEGALLLIPATFAVALIWGRFEVQQLSWRLLLLPWTYVTLVWQRSLSSNIANPGDPNAGALSLRHVWPNLKGLGQFLADPQDLGFPSSRVVLALAALGALLLLLRARTPRRVPAVLRWWLLLALLSWLVVVTVHLCFYQGNPTLPWTQRLALVHVPALAWLGAWGLERLLSKTNAGWGLAAVVTLPLTLHALPVAATDVQGRKLNVFRMYRRTTQFLTDYKRDVLHGQDLLVVATYAGMYVPLGHSSLTFESFQRVMPDVRVKLAYGGFHEILVIQELSYPTDTPLPGQQVPAGTQLEPVHEFYDYGSVRVRVSRVTALPSEEPQSAAQPPEPADAKAASEEGEADESAPEDAAR